MPVRHGDQLRADSGHGGRAQALGWILIMGQVPQMVIFSILSTIIVAPLIFPIVKQLGIDPVHLSAIMISNLAIGHVRAPFRHGHAQGAGGSFLQKRGRGKGL
ncbi:MAG: TRAP transporter large permease subunit [Synergistaceae bacterium]|jgi:TRAP-type C4-dicarboxylate transport system permease large subunit|nr:TRAP transporter large permease subunit [Synergistaceae bacterium]